MSHKFLVILTCMFANASFAGLLNQELKDIEEQLEKNHQQLLIAKAS